MPVSVVILLASYKVENAVNQRKRKADEGRSISSENQCIRLKKFTINISVKCTFSTNTYTFDIRPFCNSV